MKKHLLLLSVLAGVTLSGCSLFGPKTDGYDLVPEFAGGKKAEKVAILEAINNLSPVVNKAGADLFSDTPSTLKEDSGDYVKVTKTQVYNDLTVELEWAADDKQATYRAWDKSDDAHDIISLNFPGYGKDDTEFKWTLKKAKCGSCETKGDEVATYTAKLKGYTHPHAPITIAEINGVTDGDQTIHGVRYPSTFNMVDYDVEKDVYFKKTPGDPDPKYYYCTVKGKVIYHSPDGNWALLADGKQVLELYAGSALDLHSGEYPDFKVGEYVAVDGNLSQYKGNIQLGFITKIQKCEKGSIADPAEFGVIDSDFIADNFEIPAEYGYSCQKQAIDGFSNSICSVSGTVKAAKSGIKSGERFTFEINLEGGKTIKVAYDYHTDKEGKLGLFDKLQSKLSAAGTAISIKGTMRYEGNDSEPFKLAGNSGVWTIVPFDAANVQ